MGNTTNADYIRNMSDEEMAKFLHEHFNCKPEGDCPVNTCTGSNCKENIKKWLQAERKAD